MPNQVPAIYTPSLPTAHGAATAHASAGLDFSFHDLLDIINPLQHLPIIGTLYRAITGDHIGKFEKVAGDTLYGGLWGAVSSVADVAFEAVTGKDFGDTVLSLLTGHHDAKPPIVVVQNSTPPAAVAPPVPSDIAALTNALMQKGIDSDITQRALFAYRKSTSLTDMALTGG